MGKPVEKKRKKKGRPSLLDLQKRSLRLQKQQEQELQQQQQQQGRKSSSSNPSANPYLRFPASGTPGRPAARRDPPEAELGGEDGEDEEGGGGKRREKKLKLVLRLHQEEDGGGRSGNPQRGRGIGDSSGSESRGEDGTPRKKRKIDVVGGDGSGLDKTERQSFASKATEGEPSDSGPTTPLPDKKLLEFILDRLQKKDTYGVFAEPVDPEELPDYHEIIDHPMDFSTVRKRLSNGYYKNLEMFEKDVFLICSNAMSYNAPDTIYFRQARSIQELAKKNFENLRQDSDDEEPEPKVVRRGRPPGKNTAKKAVGRPADRASTEFAADATLANAGDSAIWSNSSYDLSRKGFASDKLGSMDTLTRSNHRFNTSETSIWMAEKSDRNDDAGAVRGTPMRSGKKVFVLDENRRNTYKQSQASTSWPESSIYTTFDGEKKQLVPQVGLNIEHAYARSLARFAANLGPLGWEIAAKQIEKVLPPGTRFGRGWVGQSDMPQQYQPPLLCTTSQPSSDIRVPSSSVLPKTVVPSEQPNSPLNNATVQVNHPCRSTPASSSSGISSIRPPMSAEPAEPAREVNHDSEFGLVSDNGTAVIGGARPRAQFQLNQNMTYRPGMNGFKVPFGFDMHQAGMMVRPPGPIGSFEQEVPMTHARVLDMVSRGNSSFSHSPQSELEGPKPIYPGIAHHPQGPRSVWRPLSLNPKPESTQPPDLNLRFQSPGSPPSGVAVDSQQPDLALQL